MSRFQFVALVDTLHAAVSTFYMHTRCAKSLHSVSQTKLLITDT